MGIDIQRLARQRALKDKDRQKDFKYKDVDIKVEEPRVQPGSSEAQVRDYERLKMAPSGKEIEILNKQRRKELGNPDAEHSESHESLKKKKFYMMKQLLRGFDDLDADGLPDSKER